MRSWPALRAFPMLTHYKPRLHSNRQCVGHLIEGAKEVLDDSLLCLWWHAGHRRGRPSLYFVLVHLNSQSIARFHSVLMCLIQCELLIHSYQIRINICMGYVLCWTLVDGVRPAFATYIEIHELWPFDLLTFLLALSFFLSLKLCTNA